MKKKLVERTEPIPAEEDKWWITVQLVEDILILNIYYDRNLKSRHCINIWNGEYATLKGDEWYIWKLSSVLGYEDWYNMQRIEGRLRMSEASEKIIRDAMDPGGSHRKYKTALYYLIESAEEEYGRTKRERAEERRQERIKTMMDRIPPVPEGIKRWIDGKALDFEDYALKDRESGNWSCSGCGKNIEKKKLRTAEGKEPRNNDIVTCPECGKQIRYLARKKKVEVRTHFAIIQPIDKEISVVRHFDALIQCDGGRKKIGIDEAVRIILFKNAEFKGKPSCDLYYNQFACGVDWIEEGQKYNAWFDNKGNRANRSEYTGYLYDGGIEEAFRSTRYQKWARLFAQMAAAGAKLNYNRMMIATEEDFISLTEMLFRGRFWKLLKETSENVSVWSGGYCGPLKLYGTDIETVFDIGDRQKINRIREKNGGELMVEWMQWSERNNQKISDKALSWLMMNRINEKDIMWSKCRMTIEQIMNYMERQRKESYSGMNLKEVINQYEDYMKMCEKLGKDTTDEMVYRPRELKRRHDECVAEIERQQAEIQAEEYSKKYKEAEAVCRSIREKLEWEDEEFRIMVPRRIVDIVLEGRYLHHCAGNTDRYFDRIKQQETYICFLRKISEPETPFYTIEVEPGGTIRQHRGMFDEEPEIETVKPFLRKWQQVIKKRMREEDHRLAAVSKQKREENIEDLKKKNNTRVLNGLMEDFMEAI